MKKIFALAMMASLVAINTGQTRADIVVEYTTAGSTSSIAANGNSSGTVTADPLLAGAGLTALTFSTFIFSGFDTASTTFDAAVAANDAWTWGFDVTTPGTSITKSLQALPRLFG